MKKNKPEVKLTTPINESTLFQHISKIIESRKARAGMFANQEVTLMF